MNLFECFIKQKTQKKIKCYVPTPDIPTCRKYLLAMNDETESQSDLLESDIEILSIKLIGESKKENDVKVFFESKR